MINIFYRAEFIGRQNGIKHKLGWFFKYYVKYEIKDKYNHFMQDLLEMIMLSKAVNMVLHARPNQATQCAADLKQQRYM